MNNKIMLFQNEVFRNVRTLIINGEPWFVATDITRILGYKNCSKAIADHVDEADKGITKCATHGGMQNLTIISESGVYSLIFHSKMPDARRFKHWITSEVLPTLRKQGSYIFDEEACIRRLFVSQDDDTIAELMGVIRKIEQTKAENAIDDQFSMDKNKV
jgi:prophage antirepressor-like protein